jgi:hypothetical protein
MVATFSAVKKDNCCPPAGGAAFIIFKSRTRYEKM